MPNGKCEIPCVVPTCLQMKVWERNMAPINAPENSPRLFDMVRVNDDSVRPAFYFALRDTLVAKDMEQATRMAFQKDKRWRVVTLQGQIIEMAGGWTSFLQSGNTHTHTHTHTHKLSCPGQVSWTGQWRERRKCVLEEGGNAM